MKSARVDDSVVCCAYRLILHHHLDHLDHLHPRHCADGGAYSDSQFDAMRATRPARAPPFATVRLAYAMLQRAAREAFADVRPLRLLAVAVVADLARRLPRLDAALPDENARRAVSRCGGFGHKYCAPAGSGGGRAATMRKNCTLLLLSVLRIAAAVLFLSLDIDCDYGGGFVGGVAAAHAMLLTATYHCLVVVVVVVVGTDAGGSFNVASKTFVRCFPQHTRTTTLFDLCLRPMSILLQLGTSLEHFKT